MNDRERTIRMPGTEHSTADEPPRLIVVAGARPGDRVALDRDATTIGRDGENDLVLDSPVVSSFHARVVRVSTVWAIEDSGSTNGVRVNGAVVDPAGPGQALRHGDVITVSDHTLLFVSRRSTADHADFSSIHIDRARAAAEAEALLREFPHLDGRARS